MENKIIITASGNEHIIIPQEVQVANDSIIVNQATSAISNFLTKLKISKIIYVDDKCSINELKADFIGKVVTLKATTPNIDFLNDLWKFPDGAFEKKISELWDSKGDEEKRMFYIEILKNEETSEDLENSLAPLSLKKHLKKRIELLSPNQWVEQKDALLATVNDNNKLLILFDIDFGKSPLADQRNGLDLAQEILLDDKVNDFIFCGIFSHLFDVVDENDKRNEYCVSHDLKKSQFYTISKRRFLNDVHLPALAEGIRNALLIDKVEEFKKRSFDILRKSFDESLKEISSLTPESFNHAIQKSSKNEGVWEVDTLFRLSNIITKNKALNTFSSKRTREEIYTIISSIREIENIKTGGQTPFDKSQIKDIREKEIYSQGKIINTIHYPLTNGDIFKIKDVEYILLTQPCNLTLRKDGSRARGYNTGFLVELVKKTSQDYLDMSFAQRAICERIEDKNGINGIVKIAQFSTFKTIDLSILDLCVFNIDGVSKIKISEKIPQSIIIPESWKKRYKNIHKFFDNYTNGILVYNKLRTSKKDELKKLIFNSSSFRDLEIDNSKSYNNRTKILEFDIKRECNYRSPYSDDLLQKFMQYLSRNAFEHDFSSDGH
ncbi:hypothetical protein GCM10022422_16470 [Flavobacterium ginsengisoli]|uniref:Response receiver domain-containing protein n=1 Tax=Flavobacterium ginsengisoli TaxID=871694 RepID=A0ABP7F9L9_9FLAO|nr:hypothetical protein [Flavobacterium ginsengisoli]